MQSKLCTSNGNSGFFTGMAHTVCRRKYPVSEAGRSMLRPHWAISSLFISQSFLSLFRYSFSFLYSSKPPTKTAPLL